MNTNILFALLTLSLICASNDNHELKITPVFLLGNELQGMILHDIDIIPKSLLCKLYIYQD